MMPHQDFSRSEIRRRFSPARLLYRFTFAVVVLIAVALWPGRGAAQDATPTPAPAPTATPEPAPIATPAPTPDAVLTREQRLEQRKEELRALVEQRKAEVTAQMGVTQPTPSPPPLPGAANALPAPTIVVGAGLQPQPTPPGSPMPTPPPEGEAAPPIAGAPDMVMMLKPFSQTVSVGQRFSTEVVLASKAGGKFESLRVCVTYPRDSVRIVKVYDYPLAEVLDEANPPLLTNEAGLLTYEADLARTFPVVGSVTVLYVVWEAVEEETAGALLLSRYNLDENHQSSVTSAGHNTLKSSTASGVSCVNAEVTIRPASNSAGGANKHPRIGYWQKVTPPEGPAADAPASNVRLEIRPPNNPPAVGDRFVLDVLVDDSLFAPFDEVRLAIGFDPKKAEVLDWDYNNWIKTGVNVFDGHAHEMFPFNIHTRNDVDNQRGRITYQMGSTKAGPRPSGCLVRIHAKALAEGAVESFTLWPKGQTSDWCTDVRLRNASVLERAKDDGGRMKSKAVAGTR